MSTNAFALAVSLPLFAGSLLAQNPVVLDVTGDATEHQLTWSTDLGFNYHIYMSTDLQSWSDTGIVEPGCGSPVAYRFAPDPIETELYYQIWAAPGSAFLILPCQWEEAALTDGICFAFDLNVLATDPAKVRISKRVFDSGAPFELIGALTDFDEINNIKFLRGSAVWIPDEVGEYEFLVQAVDAMGGVIEDATRYVSVGLNQAPTVRIDGYLPTVSSEPVDDQPLEFESSVSARFATTIIDPDLVGHPALRKDDVIRRVEFYDNGVLFATDLTPPFGDELRKFDGTLASVFLRRGSHSITARAYDSKGGVSQPSPPFIINVETGNARPTLEIISPADNTPVSLGAEFTITVEVDDDDGVSDIKRIDAVDLIANGDSGVNMSSPYDTIEMDTTGWELGVHTLHIYATDKEDDESYPVFLRIVVEDPAADTFAESLVATITTALAQDLANQRFIGVEASSGQFNNGVASGLDLQDGVLLTTGRFSSWNGGDDAADEDYTEEQWRRIGNSTLEDRIVGRFTEDAASLEFNINCVHSQLEIVVQFGSEEYLEYVGDQTSETCHNDAFIILVDGVPISLLPDCSDIVAVHSIHPEIRWDLPSACLPSGFVLPAKNEHLYLSDTAIDARVTALQENQLFQAEYDGMTIALRFHALVTPGTHHVEIIIADVDDDRYDAALFIGAGSVSNFQPQP